MSWISDAMNKEKGLRKRYKPKHLTIDYLEKIETSLLAVQEPSASSHSSESHRLVSSYGKRKAPPRDGFLEANKRREIPIHRIWPTKGQSSISTVLEVHRGELALLQIESYMVTYRMMDVICRLCFACAVQKGFITTPEDFVIYPSGFCDLSIGDMHGKGAKEDMPVKKNIIAPGIQDGIWYLCIVTNTHLIQMSKEDRDKTHVKPVCYTLCSSKDLDFSEIDAKMEKHLRFEVKDYTNEFCCFFRIKNMPKLKDDNHSGPMVHFYLTQSLEHYKVFNDDTCLESLGMDLGEMWNLSENETMPKGREAMLDLIKWDMEEEEKFQKDCAAVKNQPASRGYVRKIDIRNA